ncbi:TonB-dependent receptor [Sphingomonas radiodurans]|uniref:TonB-dependent receptor n=1 Tax=Sphingomonas radiodurans TaxID=2890321 RepID=UPI0038CDA389
MALIAAFPASALAQAAPEAQNTGTTNSPDSGFNTDIVVTAQRQSQTLQEVPIAVSAFSAAALEAQQIDNASDLQLTLPNVTFSKGNFTGSSFTIRGIGDLCVGISCDQATAIHINGSPLLATRIFETEYFDLERVEVLRGPQGTLFGRSATSGVVNFLTAKPRTDKFAASGEVEYGNYDSVRAKGMINLPIGETLAVRVAGFYLNRDGYTKNLYDNTQIDGRDMYSVRGSIRWEPSVDTTIDVMGSYFKEDDDRLRIQKQLCQTDPTGVLGCLNNRRDAGRTNTNSTFTGTLGSREFLSIAFGPALGQTLGLGSIYGPDGYTGNPVLEDPREVFTAFTPTYKTDELTIQGRIEHNFGPVKAQLTGLYHETSVDSSQDYNLGVSNRSLIQPTLNTLAAIAGGAVPGIPASYFQPIAAAIIPNGPAGDLCTSLPEPSGLGSFGGFSRCSAVPGAFDRSFQQTKDWSVEGIISTDFDGMFNFLLGGIYVDGRVRNGDYYVNAFAIDYVTGVLGTVGALGGGRAPEFSATPYFRSNTDLFRLKSYGIFGEAYFDFNDRLNLTLGLRYNNDNKYARSRSTLASFGVPYTQTGSAFDAPRAALYDADPVTAGVQEYAVRQQTFDEFTGRAVVNFKITDDNLLYASYSRGYKSGGFNPPVQVPNLTIPDAFVPEIINAFEIGSKNTFDNGKFTLNLTGFYYKYKGLQLSRIVARSSINDNIDADIYGVEAESIIRPDRDWAINIGASYLKTKVTTEDPFINQRDVSGGDPNTVIIKDLQAAFNCVVRANTAAVAQTFVTIVNTGLGLRGPQAFPSDANLGAATGAFSLCDVLTAQTANPQVRGLLPAGSTVSVSEGVGVSIKGNSLPQAPVFKFSAGVQKTFEFANGMSFVPRFDLTYTGESFGNIFNGRINRIEGYEQANAQVQLNGMDQRWFVRGFVQNIFDNSATTGLYLTDQSSGLFTNIFTLEPRRYGIAAGFKF